MELVKERISDRRVLKLIRPWLEAGVMEDGAVRETLAGTRQGGVISPLLANIYLNKLDRIWAAKCSQLGVLVRYADDFVAMCGTESQAREALRRIGLVRNRLGLTLHPAKTRLVNLRRGKESIVFLGCTIRKKRSILRAPNKHFMQRWPSPKATKKIRGRVRELTEARQSGKDVKQIIAELNPVLRGWGNYFRTGNADREFNKLDGFVFRRMRRWQLRRGGQRATKQNALDQRSTLWAGLASAAGHSVLSVASDIKKITVKLCAGKPHAQFERGLYGNGPAVMLEPRP
jgi:group II intron reverse transcriptase/maturase